MNSFSFITILESILFWNICNCHNWIIYDLAAFFLRNKSLDEFLMKWFSIGGWKFLMVELLVMKAYLSTSWWFLFLNCLLFWRFCRIFCALIRAKLCIGDADILPISFEFMHVVHENCTLSR